VIACAGALASSLKNAPECFDHSRNLTAGFLDGLQFRARRGMLRRAQHARIFLSNFKIIPLVLSVSKDFKELFFNKLLVRSSF
jgi:hypothetical protein